MRKFLMAMSLVLGVNAQAAENMPSYEADREAMWAEREGKKSGGVELSEKEKSDMKAFNEWLAKNMPAPGLKVGEKAPDFTLQDANGTSVRLYDQLRTGPVILVFYRGSWCPYCNLHLSVLKKAKSQFDKFGARIIAVTPQKPDSSLKQIQKDGFQFPVLSDMDSQVMKSYRLYFEMNEEMVAIYKKFGVDLEDYNGKGRTMLPIPGSFVIDQEGKVVAMQAQTDYKARMEPKDIMLALEEIHAAF